MIPQTKVNLVNFSKALYGTAVSTYSARVFCPDMSIDQWECRSILNMLSTYTTLIIYQQNLKIFLSQVIMA